MSSVLGQVGFRVRSSVSQFSHIVAMVSAVVCLSIQPRYWPRTVRNVFARQVLFTGVEASRFVFIVGVICGVSVVMQAQVWLLRFGQSKMLGPLLVAVVVRELGPLLTNLLVIGRSGTAIASELASMRVSRQIVLLDSQGLDPFPYLVMPRVLGVAVSVFCLTLLFIVVCLVSGFLTSALAGSGGAGPVAFAASVAQALRPVDVFVLLGKTLVPGLLMGAICCDTGFGVQRDLSEIPRAVTLGQIRSLMAVFITFLIVSVLTYL